MKCFVIMPFAESFDAIFEVVRDAAAAAVPDDVFECFWLKDVQSAGRITDDILNGLKEAAFCIADVSGHNPNVMWETGYAMALGKPTILIGQDIKSLPFDLKSHRVVEYSPSSAATLRQKLIEAIRQTLARYELRGSRRTELPRVNSQEQRTISVTGTMNANEAAVRRRIERALTPYLSSATSWLAGSVGIVDVTAVRFLIERNQRVTAVGYHRFDCGSDVRKFIDEAQLDFLDASLEPIPKGVKGPNKRDSFFCMKSDLVILVWDGQSPGTRELVQYYQDQAVATLLAFV